MRVGLAVVAGALALGLAVGCDPGSGTGAPPASVAPAKSITIWWAQWDPATGLQKLGDEFEKKTGIKVTVFQIPWPEFQTKVFQEFGKAKTDFDIVVGDSQWVGRGATDGLYVDLTSWLPTAVDIKTLHPRAAKYLSEYPPGSGKYFSAPCETDAMGFAYRKDWFEDAKEKEAFKAKHNRDLKVPDTWEEFKDVADFFTRPDKNRYGCALVTGRTYDDVVMGFEQVLYAFGGAWGDEKTRKVKGHLDTPAAAQALAFYKELATKCSPPGGTSLDYFKALDAFKNESVAMLMDYFAFFPGLADQFKEKVGFFAMPKKGDRRVASLGGQGLSISTKTAPDKQAAAKEFIKWFLRTDTQKTWVKHPGCFTGNAELLKSDEFRKATSYNAPFADSIDILQDFWNVPSYNDLLAVAVRELGAALDGKKTPEEALKTMAEEHEKILSKEK
jgi:multiple sugar transport system substrate-binding protein